MNDVTILDARGQPMQLVSAESRALSTEVEAPEQPRSLLEVVSRAAADPNFDPAKFVALMDAQKDLEARAAKQAYAEALALMQPRLPVVARKGRIVIYDKSDQKHERPPIQSTPFARWEDIHAAITPILSEYGFSLAFKPGRTEAGLVSVVTILTHERGHSESTTIELPHDSSGSKNPVQAVGSSISYGKRYGAVSLLNIRTEGEDDDGQSAWEPLDPKDDPNNWITQDDMVNLQALMEDAGVDRDKFLDYFQVCTLNHLPKKRYGEALKLIGQKKQHAGGGQPKGAR
jgi:hypothetical protein